MPDGLKKETVPWNCTNGGTVRRARNRRINSPISDPESVKVFTIGRSHTTEYIANWASIAH